MHSRNLCSWTEEESLMPIQNTYTNQIKILSLLMNYQPPDPPVPPVQQELKEIKHKTTNNQATVESPKKYSILRKNMNSSSQIRQYISPTRNRSAADSQAENQRRRLSNYSPTGNLQRKQTPNTFQLKQSSIYLNYLKEKPQSIKNQRQKVQLAGFRFQRKENLSQKISKSAFGSSSESHNQNSPQLQKCIIIFKEQDFTNILQKYQNKQIDGSRIHSAYGSFSKLRCHTNLAHKSQASNKSVALRHQSTTEDEFQIDGYNSFYLTYV